jgi:hypothetical protein
MPTEAASQTGDSVTELQETFGSVAEKEVALATGTVAVDARFITGEVLSICIRADLPMPIAP